ncbi:nucleoside monophosphate kinase [Candidatus Parcubacteria bacterium]|nr:MAG: nucleoside monophosphate kinase [Candidatus Parcubacteria bacterium]
MHIIFYGPEGSGKGTQARLLAQKLNLAHIQSGDLVRDAAKNDSGLIGEAARNALATGKYVPDSEMYVLWKNRLKQEDAKKGWIIDGFPRNLRQAKFLFNKVDKYGYKVDKVIYIKILEEESLKRLKMRNREQFAGSGKSHDDPELVKSRLQEFGKGQKDLLDYLREKGVLEEVNGERSVEEVHKDILSRLSRNKD